MAARASTRKPRKPKAAAVTNIQLGGVSYGFSAMNQLPVPQAASLGTYRQMAIQPTISLAMSSLVAAVLDVPESIEADDNVPPERVKIVQANWRSVRDEFVRTAIEGALKFGWQPFEVIFGLEGLDYYIDRIKPLLQDITKIKVNSLTGEFLGFEQAGPPGGPPVYIEPPNAFLFSIGVEGDQLHGLSTMEGLRDTWNNWTQNFRGMTRYNTYVAGSHWVVHYPQLGDVLVNGVATPNAQAAQQILDQMQACGKIMLPSNTTEGLAEINKLPDWRVEVIGDAGGRQLDFVSGLNYLDKLLVRGLGQPERALLEGMFGTRAEAAVHSDVRDANAAMLHQAFLSRVNHDLLDPLLAANYGPEAMGTIRMKSADLKTRAYLQGLIRGIGADALPLFDPDRMMDMAGLPKANEIILTPEPKPETVGAVNDETSD